MGTVIEDLHFLVWGPWTLVLFLGTGLWFTIQSGFFQYRGIGCWWRETGGSLWRDGGERREKGTEKGRKRVTRFQSACTALAATIGTGNIAGVATALTAGGPGALFWMWVSAAIGMMTAYTETYLGQLYRYRKPDGEWMCGPMVYMERGLQSPALGILYALLAVLSSLGMGSMVQSNSISGTLWSSAGMPPTVSGILVTVLVGAVILGGIRRISSVSEKLMPISAGIYTFFSLVVVISCWDLLPGIFAEIFREAIRPKSVGGGVAGFLLSHSVRYGLSRGVFSNEAGLGSLAVLHGAAEDTTPEQQGMWAMFEVFFDTIVVCTLTALVILCGQHYGAGSTGLAHAGDGAALTAWCFSLRLGVLGEILVSGSMAVFAFATIIAWYYLGRQTFVYLTERLGGGGLSGKLWDKVYLGCYLLAVYLGCVSRLETVWLISDLWNGMMAYPNLLAILWLSWQVRYPISNSASKTVKKLNGFRLDKSGGNEYTKINKRE